MSNLRVSVIVPCYNEEKNIGKCLDSLEKQTVKPFEIVVVDNNCTDRTVEIARQYARVRIVKEPFQRLIFARDTGLNAAKGDILARVDADSHPLKNWVSVIQKTFSDPAVQAVSGTGYFYDVPFKKFSKISREFFAVWVNRWIMGHFSLFGSNMTLRKSAWRKISSDVCTLPNIVEDLDISAHIYKQYGRSALIYRKDMLVNISGRRLNSRVS